MPFFHTVGGLVWLFTKVFMWPNMTWSICKEVGPVKNLNVLFLCFVIYLVK